MKDKKEAEQIKAIYAGLNDNAKQVIKFIIEAEREHLNLSSKAAAGAVVDQVARKLEGIR